MFFRDSPNEDAISDGVSFFYSLLSSWVPALNPATNDLKKLNIWSIFESGRNSLIYMDGTVDIRLFQVIVGPGSVAREWS